MKVFSKIITIAGWLVLCAGFGLILMGAVGVWLSGGFQAVAQTFNPFNIANFIATIVTLAPGLLLIALGKKLGVKEHKSGSQIER
jgi:hypothetical protein